MTKNSTLKFRDLFLKEEYSDFDRSTHNLFSNRKSYPKKETINKILSYANSVKGIKTRSNNTILISLN